MAVIRAYSVSLFDRMNKKNNVLIMNRICARRTRLISVHVIMLCQI